MENGFFNQMKNGNNLTQGITENQSRPNTVAGPQTVSFREINHKSRAKTSIHAQIQRLSPTVDEVANENKKQKPQLRRLWKSH